MPPRSPTFAEGVRACVRVRACAERERERETESRTSVPAQEATFAEACKSVYLSFHTLLIFPYSVCILVSLSVCRKDAFCSSRRLLRVRAAAAFRLPEGVKWRGLVMHRGKKHHATPTKVTYTTYLLTQLTILIHALHPLSRHTHRCSARAQR